VKRLKVVAAANRSRHRPPFRGGFRSWSLHTKLLLVTLVGIIIGGTAGWWAFPSIANAADTCGQNVKYNVEATDGAGVAHDGVHVASPGMYIYNHSASCREISSIISIIPDEDQAEVGWIDIATGEANCNTTGDNTPYVLTVWVSGGTYHCFTHGSLTANQSDPFSVWGDSSDNWTWGHNGNNVQLATLDFRTSESITNGERHSSFDSAQSQFNGMQNGTTGHWNDWTNSVCALDTDPDYNNQLQSHTYVTVSTSSQQC
jgi:hypothetical protein